MKSLNNPIDHIPQSKELQIDLKAWLFKLLRKWWLFALFIGASLAGGYLYLRYETYEYATKAIVLFKDVNNNSSISEESILLTDQGLINGGKSLDNEIQIMKSIPLMERVIGRVKANILYFRQGVFKENEIYTFAPFQLDTFNLKDGGLFNSADLYLEVNNHNRFILRKDPQQEGVEYEFGTLFSNEIGDFKISKKPGAPFVEFGNYRIAIRSIESTAQQYANRLRIELVGNPMTSGILELSLQDPVPLKSEHIINTLIEVYDEEEISDENKVLRNTLNFIDKRVEMLSFELDSVEGKLEQFKSNNAIITDDAASSMRFALDEMRMAVRQISELEIRKSILASLETFLIDNQYAYELIPSNLLSGSSSIGNLLEQYNTQLLRWQKLSTNATEQNPARVVLEKELNDLRRTILLTVQNEKAEIRIPIEENQKIVDQLSSKMGTVPGVEKKLLEQIRAQGIKENLFLYLLQRREEAALSEAVTTANTRVIDWARSTKFAIFPRRNLVYMACILLGTFIPLLLIILQNSLETRIESEDTVKRLSSIPIIARIAFDRGKEHLVVKSGKRSAISEMFRLLRTNLNFIISAKEQKPLILVTSSTSGEGKTFVTLNLGMTLALSNKKVVLLGLDLRRPKLFEYMGEKTNNWGITNYLIGESDWRPLIKQSEESPNLFFMPSGPIPPNPSELILLDKMQALLTQLMEEFDYVILDTPPMGIVADALLLRELATHTLIVVRQGYTRKAMVNQIEDMYKRQELTNPSLILNGLKARSGAYGYGQGYQYGYYEKN